MLVDSHCHLDFPALAGDRAGVLARARAAGVGTLLTISTKLAEFETVHAIAEGDPDIWCSVGTHPHEAEGEADVAVETLTRLAQASRVVGIGECGLDYYYDHAPRQLQQAVFRTHIAAAREVGLPLIVHTRDADQDTARILGETAADGRLRGVLHCFTSGQALALAALDLGFYISFSGIVTFKNAEALRQTVRAVPVERILVETDAPFLAPVPHRGKPNEPSFVTYTAAAVAALKGLSPEELARRSTENFFRLFDKAAPPAPTA